MRAGTEYYRNLHPYPAMGNPPRLTLAGEMEEYVDDMHAILDFADGENAPELDGVLAEQVSPDFVKRDLMQLAINAMKPFNNITVDNGKTPQQLAAQYVADALGLLKAYGRG